MAAKTGFIGFFMAVTSIYGTVLLPTELLWNFQFDSSDKFNEILFD